MFDRILKRMREKVRTRQYIMSLHAEEEMNDDELSIFDVESVILTGKIIERQKEEATTVRNGNTLYKVKASKARA